MLKWIILSSMMFPMLSFAQPEGTISGRVMDLNSRKPLESANIILKGTTIGTSSAKDGTFRFFAPIGHQIIIVSFVGFETIEREIVVQSENAVEVVVLLNPKILPGQTIVVTSTRGKVRETPATFSTLEAKELAQRYNTQDIPQILSELPSTTFYSDNGNGIGYNYLNIRGFDQRRISVMINGIPQNDPEDHNVYWLDFPDLAANLEDIQVQRGAGSAFYGPAAIGGSVNLITSSFALSPGITVSSGIGTFNTQKYSVKANSGLVGNRYAFQAKLSRIISDGYRERSWADFSSYFLGAVRYDETMTTQLNFYGGPVSDGLAYVGVPKSDIKNKSLRRKNYSYWEPGYSVERRPEEIENFSQPHYELLHEWKINESLTLNNSLFYVTGEGFFDYDGSWAPYSYFRLTPQSGHPDSVYISNALIHAWVENRQFGWLPRATIKHKGGELTVGAELRRHRSVHWGALKWGEGLPAGVTPEYHYYEYRGAKEMASLYAHEVWRLRPDLTVMVDLQYAYNKYRLYDERYLGTDFSVPYHFVNPRAGINYNITAEWNVYAQIARTSREPRLKNLYDAAEASTPAIWGVIEPQFEQKPGGGYDYSRPLVKPEVLTDIEIGGGYSTPGLRATANFYLMEFSNEIIRSGQLDRFGQPITGNAEKTRHLGVELTGTVAFGQFELHANATLSQNRLVKYTVFDSGTPQSLDGNTIAGFPDLIANARASYASDGFSVVLSMQHVGDFYTDNFQNPGKGTSDPNRTVDAHTVFHAWLNYRMNVGLGQSVELRFQISNLFDAIYASHGEGDDFFPAATRNVFGTIQVTL